MHLPLQQTSEVSQTHSVQKKKKGQQQLTGMKHHLNCVWKSLAHIKHYRSACQVVNTITRSPSSLMLIIVCASKCSVLCFCFLLLLTRHQSSASLLCCNQRPVLTNQNVLLFTLKWCGKQKSAFPAVRVIFRVHWRKEEEKKKKTRKMHVILHFRLSWRVGGDIDVQERHEEQGIENGEKEQRWAKESKRERQSHLVWFISGRIIWLAGGKLLYQSPKGRSDFLNHFNKLEECDCPDSAAVSVLIRHSALSELATHEPTEYITINGLLSVYTGKQTLPISSQSIVMCQKYMLLVV